MDEVKISLARQAAAERGFKNVEFRVLNVNDTNEPSAYDVVYCRALLHHLSHPVELPSLDEAGIADSAASPFRAARVTQPVGLMTAPPDALVALTVHEAPSTPPIFRLNLT